MFLEIHTDTRRRKPYLYGLFLETFRQDGRVRHRTRGRVTCLTLEQLRALRGFFRQDCPRGGVPALQVSASREYGASAAVLQVAKALGLERLLYSRREAWVCYALAMIVGRVVYQGSKLSLTQRWRDTGLWPLCGVEENPPHVDAVYAALDRLVARRHLGEGCVVLYDVTSSYFEGEHRGSGLVDFGHNRDGKRGHQQIVIGLLADPHGCPVGVSVYRRNTSDQKTQADRVTELKEEYGLQDVVMVGDRGMLTSARLTELSAAGLHVITALTHQHMRAIDPVPGDPAQPLRRAGNRRDLRSGNAGVAIPALLQSGHSGKGRRHPADLAGQNPEGLAADLRRLPESL